MHESRRPVGGIEMGGKASYCQQKTLRLQRDDGEITEVAVDEETQVETIAQPARESSRAPAVVGRDRPTSAGNALTGVTELKWLFITISSSGCCCSWRSSSALAPLVRRAVDRPAQAVAGQGRHLRVRREDLRRDLGPVPDSVLHLRPDVRGLRHRDRVPLSLGGQLRAGWGRSRSSRWSSSW